MPSRSRKQIKRRHRSRQNQKGGSDGAPQISEATLKQAGEIAQKLLGQTMQQGNNNAQTGGSASGAAPQSGVSSSSSAPIQNAMVGGAVAGAVAGAAVAEAAEPKSALNMSPLVGGGRKRGSNRLRLRKGKRQSQSESESQSQSQNQNQNQTGGMVPGLMAAVETALVPLGLYLGQKALQSRRSGKSFVRSFNSRKFSRRNRSSRRR
jgi:hypothetical protein